MCLLTVLIQVSIVQQHFCLSQLSGDHTVVWRKGHQVLAAGPMLIIKDDRFKLHPADNTLEVSNILPQDAGDFVCQISLSAGETLEIAHTVEVLGKQHNEVRKSASVPSSRPICFTGERFSANCVGQKGKLS